MSEIHINSIGEIASAAQKFLPILEQNRIFAFYGDMGAGKTTFIKELCKQMKVESEVNSPTFAIVNEYESHKYGVIYHFDFYRIESVQEIIDLGFHEYINSGAYIFMEWPEKLEHLLPEESLVVKIIEENTKKRVVIY